MPRRSHGFWQYVKGAFNARLSVKGLGGVPANWLALGGFAVLGVVNPGFLLVGLGLEIAYLAVLSHDARFRKVIDGQRLLAEAARWQEQLRARAATLSPEHRRQLAALIGRCARLATLSEPPGGARDPVRELREGNLNRLVWIYARLLQSQEIITGQIDPLARDQIERELRRTDARLAGLPESGAEAIRRSLQSTVDILRRRLANLATAGEKLRFIEAELARIEQQIELIIEEAALAKNADDVSARIDAVASTLDETNAWMSANSDVLGDLRDDLEPPPVLVQSPPRVEQR